MRLGDDRHSANLYFAAGWLIGASYGDESGLAALAQTALTLAEAARSIGPLPDHYLQQVLFYLNEEMP